MQCEYYALEGLSKLLNSIQLVQRYLNPSLAVEGVLLTMYDERFTTVTAERGMLEAGLDAKQRRQVVDKVAAAVMLQAWLDHRAGTWTPDATSGGSA